MTGAALIVKRGVHWQLVWMSLIAVMHGVAFLGTVPPDLTPGLSALPESLLAVYAGAWLLSGLSGFVSAVVARRGWWWARLVMAAMCGVWAGAYTFGWLWQGNEGAWFFGAVYALFGLTLLTPPLWTVTIRMKAAE